MCLFSLDSMVVLISRPVYRTEDPAISDRDIATVKVDLCVYGLSDA
jgi:hypothetical protein